MIFDDLDILYSEIDNYYAIKEFDAHSKGLHNDEFAIQLQREHNDQAYYLYIFTRLEKRIEDLFKAAIAGRSAAATDDKDKNAWRLIGKKRMDLMEKVTFFVENGGTVYNEIYNYKKKRDDVAHGDFASGINIPTILVDMKRLYVALDN